MLGIIGFLGFCFIVGIIQGLNPVPKSKDKREPIIKINIK